MNYVNHNKVNMSKRHFKSSNKSIFFIHIKMSKNLLTKYYQENKAKLQKSL